MPSYPVRPQNLSAIRPTMTSLSRRHAAELYNFSDLTRMARLWLVLGTVMAFGSSGCLVTGTPEITAPPPIAPLLADFDPLQADILEIPREPGTPSSTNTYVRTGKVKFRIRSTEIRHVFGACVVDFLRPTQHTIATLTAAPEDLDKPLTCDLHIPPSIGPGCHSITALVSHDATIVGAPRLIEDLGLATWWAQIGTEDMPTRAACEPKPLPRDAGADAHEGGRR
jgi:hypothetical protein